MLQKGIALLLLFALVVNLQVTRAQEIVHTSLEVASGLPSPTIYDISQDNIGFIWIANQKGLCRFDGFRYTEINGKLLQGKALSNINWVNNVLYCQDFSGNFYAKKEDKLIKLNEIKNYGSYVSSFAWNKGLVYTNNNSLKYHNFISSETKILYNKSSIRSAFTLEKDSFFFLTKDSIWCLYSETKTTSLKYFKLNTDVYYLLKLGNKFFGCTRTTFPYVYELDNASKPIKLLNAGLSIQNVQLLNNEIWISTTTGAFCFNKSFEPMYGGKCYFKELSISKVFIDKNGNHWFATTDGGIKILNRMNNTIWKPEFGSVSAMSKGQNIHTALIGTTTNSVYAYTTETNTTKLIYKGKSKSEIVNLFYEPRYQTLYISGGEITKVDRNNQSHLFAKLAGKQFARINENTYALAHANGIRIVKLEGAKTQAMPFVVNGENNIELIKGERAKALAYDSVSQLLYTSSASGMHAFGKGGKTPILFSNQAVYPSNFCWVHNTLFVGTYHQGLFKLINGSLQPVKVANGNLPESVQIMQFDGKQLWIMNNQKLFSYHPYSNKLNVYDAADGLPTSEWKDLLWTGSTLLLACSEGVVSFSPTSKKTNNLAALVLDQFYVNNKIQKFSPNLELKPDENNLLFNFSVINFINNKDWLLQYRINGSNWKKLESGVRSLPLISLNSGNYNLEVGLINQVNTKSISLTKLHFSIQTIWYKKWIFILGMALLLIVSVSSYYRFSIRITAKQNKLIQEKINLEKELQQSLLSSIKSQMNPHFLFNALNTIQSYIYSNDKENASNYLGKFSDLTRLILEMSSKEKICLSEEIKALSLYMELESLRFEREFTYKIEVQDSIIIEKIFLPGMLIQPYVENAIKHGLMHKKGEWLLAIRFKLIHNLLQVEIEDNGIGRKASAEINQKRKSAHLGFSSHANEKRITILNKLAGNKIGLTIKDKTDAFGNATGTLVVFEIPIPIN